MKPEPLIYCDIPIQVETERLILRIPCPADGKSLQSALASSVTRLQEWFEWGADPGTIEDSKLFALETQTNYWMRSKFDYIIQQTGDDAVMGMVSFLHRKQDPLVFEFAYWLGGAYEGKGYMSEAVRAGLRLMFERLHVHKVIIRAEEDNLRSQQVALRNGFTYEGKIRHYKPRNTAPDQMSDMCVYSLLCSEYRKGGTV